MNRIERPAAPPLATPAGEPDFTPATPRSRAWRDTFARPRDRSVFIESDNNESRGSLDDLERFIEEERATRQQATAQRGQARNVLQLRSRGQPRPKDLKDPEDEDRRDDEDSDDLITRRLQGIQRGSQGGSGQRENSGQSRQSRANAILFVQPRQAAVRAVRAEHPVQLLLSQLEASCRAAQDSGAPQAYFAQLLDANLRGALLLSVQAVAAGTQATTLLDDVGCRLQGLYARHASGLSTSLGDAAAALTDAFHDWRAPEASLHRLRGVFVALPALYLWIRSGSQKAMP